MKYQTLNQNQSPERRTMRSWGAILALILAVACTGGCSMCCGPYDFDYPTFGGKHERVDRAYGRVGSIFSDPNAGYYGESADSNLSKTPAERDRSPNSSPDPGDDDMEQFRRELESITPSETPSTGETEELPQPDDTDPTASRRWKNRPLRSEPQWR